MEVSEKRVCVSGREYKMDELKVRIVKLEKARMGVFLEYLRTIDP